MPTITRGLNLNLPTTLTGAGSLALSILNAGYALDIELSALQTEGRGEVISNPRIVTSNQKEATITQGEEIGYLTLTGAGTAFSITVLVGAGLFVRSLQHVRGQRLGYDVDPVMARALDTGSQEMRLSAVVEEWVQY